MPEDANDLKPADCQNNIASPHFETHIVDIHTFKPGHKLVAA